MNIQSAEIKSINRIRIVQYLLEKGDTSKADIAATLHLSMPTTLTAIKELTELGLVTESGIYASTGGRKAKALSINPEGAYAVGIEIHANSVQFVLTNLKQELVASRKVALMFSDTAGYDFDLYQQMMDFLQEVRPVSKPAGVEAELPGSVVSKPAGVEAELPGSVVSKPAGVEAELPDSVVSKLAGVGLALPGSVDSERCLLLQSYELRVSNRSFAGFAARLNCPLTLENAANAALLSEADRKNDNLILFSLDQTPDGAVRMNGAIYRGDRGRGGNFGHMMMKRGGRECYCGREGCAAAYLSSRVLEKASDGSLEDFFARVKNKDSSCIKVWNKYQDMLIAAVANLRVLYDCEIILSGPVSTYLEEYAPDLAKQLRKLNKTDGEKYLSIAKYADQAAAYGISRKLVTDALTQAIC